MCFYAPSHRRLVILVRIDELVETLGHLAVILDAVALDDASGEAGQAGELDWIDQLVQALVLEQGFKGVTVEVFGVQMRPILEQCLRQVGRTGSRQSG